MKIIELILVALVFFVMLYVGYFIFFIGPNIQSEMTVSKYDLKTLTEYKLKYPEFVGSLCKNALSDGIMTRREYYEITDIIANHEESLLYKQLTE